MGTVSGIEGPFWNEADGQRWEYVPSEGQDYTTPFMFRLVTIHVDEILRDDIGVKRVASPFTPRVVGLLLSWHRAETSRAPGGQFEVGEKVLFAAVQRSLLYARGSDRCPATSNRGLLRFYILCRKKELRWRSRMQSTHLEPLAAVLARLEASRSIDHPEWDSLRYGRHSAADVRQSMERDKTIRDSRARYVNDGRTRIEPVIQNAERPAVRRAWLGLSACLFVLVFLALVSGLGKPQRMT